MLQIGDQPQYVWQDEILAGTVVALRAGAATVHFHDVWTGSQHLALALRVDAHTGAPLPLSQQSADAFVRQFAQSVRFYVDARANGDSWLAEWCYRWHQTADWQWRIPRLQRLCQVAANPRAGRLATGGKLLGHVYAACSEIKL